MKKIICSALLIIGLFQYGKCVDFAYEVTKSTFVFGTVTASSVTPTLVSWPDSEIMRTPRKVYETYSFSLWNITPSSAAYALSLSTWVAPGLTCSNGPIIGIGSPDTPTIITEQFEGMYMWVISCANNASITFRRVLRGR